MDERELVLTSLIYPLIFRDVAQIGIATPIAVHIRELLKIQTPEPEVTEMGLPVPVAVSVRNLYQEYDHPPQDYAQIGVAKPVGAYFKNLFNEYIHPHSDFTQIGNATPVSLHQVNLLKNLQTFKTDHTAHIGNAIPEAVYSTCKPVVFAPTNLRGRYNGTSIQLFWSNNSITHSHQNLYRSTTPFTEDNLPPVYQYIFRGVNSYIDEDVVEGVTYYYAVSAEAGLVQLVSDVTEVATVEISNCDLHWDKVVALLHFDDGLHDETGKVFSGGLITTGGKLVANGSAFIDCYHDDFIFGNSDFTIESILTVTDTPNSAAGYGYILNKTPNSPDSDYVLCITYISGAYRFKFRGMGLLDSGIFTDEVQPNVEYHVAVVRNGVDISLYLNGVFQQSMYVGEDTLPNRSGPLRIGTFSYRSYTHGFRGTIDELRITKGVARYTENFTPPTEPFPNFGCVTPQLPEVIGEEFGGGFYIGDITIPGGPDAGTYVIIMAGTEGQVTAHWKTADTTTVGTDSTTYGMVNTLAMEAAGLAAHPAAKHCREYTGGGHDDWYLPAKDELNLAWINRSVLSELGMTYRYWSSTQGGSSTAWYQDFNDGHQLGNSRKNWPYSVRPVRRIRKS